VAGLLSGNDPAGDALHRLGIGYRGAAVFLDDETHGEMVAGKPAI
jgi:hypothetical protein